MEENKYHPFTKEEYEFVKERMKALGSNLPKKDFERDAIWDWCTMIRGVNLGNPGCACQSTHGKWIACYNDIYAYFKKIDEQG